VKTPSLEYILLVSAMILFIGRVFWLPVALFIVTGSSMLPAYRAGDVVLGVATYIAGYGIGDTVVWYATFIHGTIHRVYSIYAGYVVTKGDNNPMPDPPVPASFVKYRVVHRIPREVWASIVVALLALLTYRKRKRLVEILKSEDSEELKVATIALTVFIVLDLAAVLLVPVYWFSYRAVLYTPTVELRSLTVKNFSVAFVEYSISYTEMRSVDSCSISIGDSSYRCSYVWISGSTAVVGISREVFHDAYIRSNGTIVKISIALSASFDKGRVYGVYNYVFNWKPLDVNVAGKSLVVYNPNPIPFNLSNIRIVYLDLDRFGRPFVVGEEHLGNMTVEPLSQMVIVPEEKGSYCYIQFTYGYKFSGKGTVYESRRIDLHVPP